MTRIEMSTTNRVSIRFTRFSSSARERARTETGPPFGTWWGFLYFRTEVCVTAVTPEFSVLYVPLLWTVRPLDATYRFSPLVPERRAIRLRLEDAIGFPLRLQAG